MIVPPKINLMKPNCIYLLMLTLLACESKNQTSTPGKGNLDARVEQDKMEEISREPLPKSAEKFKGEYQDMENERIKSLIRDHPGKPGFLANTLQIGSREPGTVAFWYDTEQDVLSSKKADAQKNFSILSLDASGNKLMEVHFDWENNKTDTTLYIRTQ